MGCLRKPPAQLVRDFGVHDIVGPLCGGAVTRDCLVLGGGGCPAQKCQEIDACNDQGLPQNISSRLRQKPRAQIRKLHTASAICKGTKASKVSGFEITWASHKTGLRSPTATLALISTNHSISPVAISCLIALSILNPKPQALHPTHYTSNPTP